MTRIYNVTLEVEVTNPEALYKEAYIRMIDAGIEKDEVEESLKDDEGNINVEYCLVWIFDPGADTNNYGVGVIDSGAEFMAAWS